jgi:hypothetical protein
VNTKIVKILTDNNGIPLSCSEPIASNHNDAYNLSETVERMLSSIKQSDFMRGFSFFVAIQLP